MENKAEKINNQYSNGVLPCVSVLFLSVGKIKNKPLNIYDFNVTCCRYDKSKTIDTIDVLIKVETSFKRKTSMKYAKNKVLQELNKNAGQHTRDRYQYFSIF